MTTDETIIILGANGQLGFDIKKLINNKYNCIALKREDFDCLNDDIIQKLNAYNNVKYVINCIAMTNVDKCETEIELAFKINAHFLYTLSKWCSEKNIILIQFSTDYIFDGTSNTPYSESDIANPVNIYGLSKYLGELIVKQYANKYFIFRVSFLFGVNGATGKGGNFITALLKLASERKELSVICDQYMSPTSTLGVARCILYFIENQIVDFGIYNLTSNNYCSRYEFAMAVLKEANLDESIIKKVSFNDYKFIVKRPKYSVLNIDKISKYFNLKSWQDELKEYFQITNHDFI